MASNFANRDDSDQKALWWDVKERNYLAGTSSQSSVTSSESGTNSNKAAFLPIKIKNPNRVVKEVIKKMDKLDLDEKPNLKPDLTPGDRKQLAKQEARKRYEKLHTEGKTYQAKADLKRLAVIKQQRLEDAAKRKAEIVKKADQKK